jgi:FtsZ-interacting cell division protein ZipA
MAFVSTTFLKNRLSSRHSLLECYKNRNRFSSCHVVVWAMTASNGKESSARKSGASDKPTAKSDSSSQQEKKKEEVSKASQAKAEVSKSASTPDAAKTVTQKQPTTVEKQTTKEPVEQKKTVSNKPKWSKALPFMLWPKNLDGKFL